MSCSKSLTIGPAVTGENPMDSACYNSSDGFIYAVRGGRVFKINATSGAILAQSDYDLRLRPGASIAYASVNNTLWAGGWNDPTSNQALGNAIPSAYYFSPRRMYKIAPSTLTVLQALDLDSNFPSGATPNAWDSAQQPLAGVQELKAVGSVIYGVFLGFQSTPSATPIVFDPSNTASYTLGFSGGVAGQFAVQPGNFVWAPDVTFPRIVKVNMTTGAYVNELDTWSGGSPATVHDFYPLAVEYSDETGDLFCTSQSVGAPGDGGFIYRLSVGLFEVAQLNTGRTNFAGVHLRRCPVGPNTGLLYGAGFGDNTVVVVNPTTNGMTVKTGFDLPYDFVFTPSKVWCVQQGTVALKEVV